MTAVASTSPALSPTRFVGREEELELLRLVFDRVTRGTPHLVTVTGEAGVGKGRLVSEFASRLERDGLRLTVLQGRCRRLGAGMSFAPLREIVRAHVGIQPGDDPATASAKIAASVRAAVTEEDDADWLIARLAPLDGVDPGRIRLSQDIEQSEWFAAWGRFLVGVARAAGPLVLVFRDMQWADDALTAFIHHLVDASSGANLLVVCLARPDLYDRAPEWGGGKRLSMSLSLTALSAPETAELVDQLVEEGGSSAALDAVTKDSLIERSAGIPLFAEQFVALVEARNPRGEFVGTTQAGADVNLSHDGESGDPAGAARSIPVPDSLRSLIASRLADLPTERRRVLLDAAVVGRQFWVGAVAAVAAVEEDAVRAALHELARLDLIRQVRDGRIDPGRPAGDQEFAFANGLIRDVAYESAQPEELASKHVRAADWIEEAAPRLGDQTDLLVHHLERAVELAPSSSEGRTPGFDLERTAVRAMEYLVAAGDRAIRFDVDRARRVYLRALERCPPDHARRPQVLARVARSAWLLGDFDESRAQYEAAIAASLAGGDRATAGGAMLGLSYTLWNQGATARAREVLADGVALLEEGEPGEVLTVGYATLAADRFLGGDSVEALRWCEKVMRLAGELDLPEQMERALEVRGMARCDLGDQDGLEDLRAALRMAMDLGLGQETARAYINLGTFVLPVDGPAAALELYRAAQTLAERRGLIALAMWTRGWSVGPLFELGWWDELLREADAVAQWERERAGLAQFGLAARLTEAEVLVIRGHAERAAKLVEEFLPQAREIGDPQALIPALAVSALVASGTGDAERAVSLLEELAPSTQASTGRWAKALFLALAVRILVGAGRVRQAEQLLDGADRSSARARHSAASATAAVAEANGSHEEAAELYAAAAAGWEAYGFVLERALALTGEARCLAATGRDGDAADRWVEGRALLTELGVPEHSNLYGMEPPERLAGPPLDTRG